MPVSSKKIHPFLAAVISGGTVKIGVGTWIGLIDESNQVVLQGSFMLHVEVKLPVHRFELGT